MTNFQSNDIQLELLKNLQLTTTLVQNLLNDIKDHAGSLAIIKEKIQNLGDSVESLSHIVRDDNGKNSMITRLALNEKSIEDTNKELHEIRNEVMSIAKRHLNRETKNEEDEKKFKREKSVAKWKLWGALIASFAAILFQLFQLIK